MMVGDVCSMLLHGTGVYITFFLNGGVGLGLGLDGMVNDTSLS